MPASDLIRVSLDDRIWGIDGVYRGKEKADGFDDEEDLYYVKYSPPSDQFTFIGSMLRSLLPGGAPVEEPPEPIPKSQINRKTCSQAGKVPGVPPQKVVLTRTRNGEAYYEDERKQELEEKLRRERKRAQKKSAEARKKEAEGAREEMVEEEDNRRRRDRRDEFHDEVDRPTDGDYR